jgi:hypothetical protein
MQALNRNAYLQSVHHRFQAVARRHPKYRHEPASCGQKGAYLVEPAEWINRSTTSDSATASRLDLGVHFDQQATSEARAESSSEVCGLRSSGLRKKLRRM